MYRSFPNTTNGMGQRLHNYDYDTDADVPTTVEQPASVARPAASGPREWG